MTISHIQTLTPQMRQVLQTCRQRGGTARFAVSDVHERTLIQLNLRGWVDTCDVQDMMYWRHNPSDRAKRATITVAYDVTLTEEGQRRAQAIDRL